VYSQGFICVTFTDVFEITLSVPDWQIYCDISGRFKKYFFSLVFIYPLQILLKLFISITLPKTKYYLLARLRTVAYKCCTHIDSPSTCWTWRLLRQSPIFISCKVYWLGSRKAYMPPKANIVLLYTFYGFPQILQDPSLSR
jgi:hypothetical protein